MAHRLDQQVAIVTGASRGIGRAIALNFAAAGAAVGICARGQAGLDAAVAELAQHGQAVHGIGHDMMEAVALNAAAPLSIRHLFVYGTLMAGEANAHHLEGVARSPGVVSGKLHDCGAYPALSLAAGEVQGELVELPLERLAGMDALEGSQPGGAPGGMYRRSVLPVRTASGVVRAYAYVMDEAQRFPVIAAGDWRSVGNRHEAWADYAAVTPEAER